MLSRDHEKWWDKLTLLKRRPAPSEEILVSMSAGNPLLWDLIMFPERIFFNFERTESCLVVIQRNVVHASDSQEGAQKEIQLWFQAKDLLDWDCCDQPYTTEVWGTCSAAFSPVGLESVSFWQCDHSNRNYEPFLVLCLIIYIIKHTQNLKSLSKM